MFNKGDIVNVVVDATNDRTMIAEVVNHDTFMGTVRVYDASTGLDFDYLETAVSLVRSNEVVEDVAARNNRRPLHNIGDRVRVFGTVGYITQFYGDAIEGYQYVIDDNGSPISEINVEAHPVPNIPWTEVEGLIREKMRGLVRDFDSRDISKKISFTISADYYSGNDIDISFKVTVDYDAGMTANDLDTAYGEAIRRYEFNQANKPKMLPKR